MTNNMNGPFDCSSIEREENWIWWTEFRQAGQHNGCFTWFPAMWTDSLMLIPSDKVILFDNSNKRKKSVEKSASSEWRVLKKQTSLAKEKERLRVSIYLTGRGFSPSLYFTAGAQGAIFRGCWENNPVAQICLLSCSPHCCFRHPITPGLAAELRALFPAHIKALSLNLKK